MDHLEPLQTASRKRMRGHPTKLSKKQEEIALQDPEYLELRRCLEALREVHDSGSYEYNEARKRAAAKEYKIIQQALSKFQEEWRAEQHQHIVSTCGVQSSALPTDYEFQRLLRLDPERAHLDEHHSLSCNRRSPTKRVLGCSESESISVED
jgi:hypothetical protein